MDRIQHHRAIGLVLSALVLMPMSTRAFGDEHASTAKADDLADYLVDENVLIPARDGAKISAFTVQHKDHLGRLPAVLSFGIYTYPWFMDRAREIADRGYVAVFAFTRGKRHSPDPIVPYEHDGADANEVIEWITRQAWSNGEVGMFGGSYLGFVQWSAVKGGVHPALKTIVPQVAVAPGIDFPMENNVFWSGNTLPWTYYVGNGPGLDEEYYGDRQRWSDLFFRWYETGVPYRELDSLNDRPSPIFRRWLDHPGYDHYWQAMIPQGREFAQVDIPVLATTGYYDGTQISVVHYFREHTRHDPDAEHYLVIGPYDHRSGQHTVDDTVANYTIDPVAKVNMRDVAMEWLDHVLLGKPRPAIVADRVNYQVMGADAWRHAPSIEGMRDDELTLHLGEAPASVEGLPGARRLTAEPPAQGRSIRQVVDFADREGQNNYFTWRVLHEEVDPSNGVAFVSDPFEEAVEISGIISGELVATINKRDFDLALTFYELQPDGIYFYLTYFRGRASYAEDRSKRLLLAPGERTQIPFDTGRLISRQLSKGSRLVVLLNGNKHPFEQINYGTGRDVSDESLDDAKEPLRIEWGTESVVRVPVRWGGGGRAEE